MSYHKLSQSPTGARSSSLSEIEDDEKHAFLGSASGSAQQQVRCCRQASRVFTVGTTLNLLLFVVSVTLFSITIYKERFIINASLRRVSTYSPIHSLVDLETHAETVNGTLFMPQYPSIARQSPNPKADALWEEWELGRIFPVSRADIVRMGKDPTTAVKLENEHWGLGDDAYATIFDVYHQLHCLNSLRQIAYGNYYNRSTVHADRLKLPELHLNHCVDILMQALQCSGNVNLITMHWVETQPYPFPDMSVNRQCINFEKLTDWRLAHTLDLDKYVEVMKKPTDVKEAAISEDYFKLFSEGEEVWQHHQDLVNSGGSSHV